MRNCAVLGYYHKANLGDEMFKESIPLVFKDYNLTFINTDEPDIDLNKFKYVIVGGGDLINNYFFVKLEGTLKLFRGKKIILGVGIPFRSIIFEKNYLELFDEVYIREETDLRDVQRLIGGEYAHFLPDLGFKLPYRYDWNPREKHIAVFLAQSNYKHKSIMYSITNIIENILSRGYIVTLIRFNTSGSKVEDDKYISKDIFKSLSPIYKTIKYDSNVYTVNEMIKNMSTYEAAICVRFHAHIFCTLSHTPFMSISSTRKTELYMNENGLSEYQIKTEMDSATWKPVSLSVSKCIETFDRLIRNKHLVNEKLKYIDEQMTMLWDTDQPSLRMAKPKRILPMCRRKRVDVDTITEDCKSLLECMTKGNGGKINRAIASTVARRMCFMITNQGGSQYIHGTTDNIMKSPEKIRDMVCWIYKDFYSKPDIRVFRSGYISQDSFAGVHRSGWQFVIERMRMFESPFGVLLDQYIDRTFGWELETMAGLGIVPYTSPWVGFIHHTFETSYTEYNVLNMIRKKEFKASLRCCVGLYTLSEDLAIKLRKELDGVLIESLFHPTDLLCPKWSMDKFKSNVSKKIVNVGAWYRNPFSIYEVKVPDWITKAALKGKRMENYFPPSQYKIKCQRITDSNIGDICCRSDSNNKWTMCLAEYISRRFSSESIELSGDTVFEAGKEYEEGSACDMISKDIAEKTSSVEILATLSNKRYDELLSRNIVFVNLISCSAANTIVECFVRHTPIVINRIPPVVEVLGENYPLYYDDLDEIINILTLENIEKTHEYMKTLDITRASMEIFYASMRKGDIFKKCVS